MPSVHYFSIMFQLYVACVFFTEWVSNHPITVKADVYNYGMLLLEIIGGRRNLDMSFGAEDFFYPGSAYKVH